MRFKKNQMQANITTKLSTARSFFLENCYLILYMLAFFFYPLPNAAATAIFEAERNGLYTLQ